jgi:acylpyruvate hydrolase
MQDSSTSEMVFSVAELISFLSHSFTLQPGDVIATGTPDGVGVFRKPPVFLKDGDFLQMEIEDIGVLENTCRTNP